MKKALRAQNPFHFGQVVEDDAYCSRTALEKRLRSRIMRGQNTVVLGNRRVGKTSLIWNVAARRRGWKVWYVDFLGIKSGEDFLSRGIQALVGLESQASVLNRVLKALPRISVSVSPDPVTGLPSLTPSIAPNTFQPDNITGLLKIVSDSAAKRRFVVIFDEFQDVCTIPDCGALLAVLRGRIQFMGDIPFVFAGSVRNDMWRLFADERSPMYKSADFIEVGSSDFDDFPGFLEARFRSGGKKVTGELLKEALQICDSVPGDVQQMCAALWDSSRGEKVTHDDIGPALEEIFQNEERSYELIVTELSAQQLKVLAVLARKGGESVLGKEFVSATGITHTSSVKRALTRLCQRRLVFRSSREYRFSNPFLRLWLMHKGYS
ncbi:ATP-binding protein [Verrucomicrobiota bacterium]